MKMDSRIAEKKDGSMKEKGAWAILTTLPLLVY
jgi:hypothetical protein